LGHALDLQVIAEGGETPTQAEFLRYRDCHHGLGYLFGRPQVPTELVKWPACLAQ